MRKSSRNTTARCTCVICRNTPAAEIPQSVNGKFVETCTAERGNTEFYAFYYGKPVGGAYRTQLAAEVALDAHALEQIENAAIRAAVIRAAVTGKAA